MTSTKNPFPGMNPFLEENWGPVHTALISFMWEAIGNALPRGLLARPEERLAIDELIPPHRYRADVGITESWKQGIAPSWQPDSSPGITLMEPEILRVDEEIERWIEIRTVDGRVVTVIELLSPANKNSAWDRYKLKQYNYLQSHTSLVEIDLLRSGRNALPLPDDYLKLRKKPAGTHYTICCSRAWRPGTRELYTWPIRDRVPAVRIPLRPTDKDIVLDLQPLIDRCYETGRYYEGHFEEDPEPPFPADEAAWVDEQLRAAGLRAHTS